MAQSGQASQGTGVMARPHTAREHAFDGPETNKCSDHDRRGPFGPPEVCALTGSAMSCDDAPMTNTPTATPDYFPTSPSDPVPRVRAAVDHVAQTEMDADRYPVAMLSGTDRAYVMSITPDGQDLFVWRVGLDGPTVLVAQRRDMDDYPSTFVDTVNDYARLVEHPFAAVIESVGYEVVVDVDDSARCAVYRPCVGSRPFTFRDGLVVSGSWSDCVDVAVRVVAADVRSEMS